MKKDGNQSPEVIVPLGNALKDARLAASLSIDEVAEKLNLGPCTVRDLEDNLDEILVNKKYPVIYLRGYLANYAKLVGLATLELFVEYQQLESSQKKKKILTSSNLIIPPTKKRSKILPLSILIIIALVTLGYVFQKQLFNSSAQVEAVTESTTKIGQPTKLLINNSQSSADEPIQEGEIVEPEKGASNAIATLESPITASQNASPDVVVAVTDTVPEKIVVIETNSEQHTLAVEASFDASKATQLDNSAQEVADASIEEADAKSSPESLILSFNQECWTEVFDATGKRIAFGLYKNGRVLMLSGVAPFQLKLGDPSVVEIQYQDQIVEGEFTPGRSAQFSVPLS